MESWDLNKYFTARCMSFDTQIQNTNYLKHIPQKILNPYRSLTWKIKNQVNELEIQDFKKYSDSFKYEIPAPPSQRPK